MVSFGTRRTRPVMGFIPYWRLIADCCEATKECENEAVHAAVEFALVLHRTLNVCA